MDVLSDLLPHLSLECDLEVLPRCFAPWGLDLLAQPEAVFHLVLGGTAHLRVEGARDCIELHAGDFVLLPQGSAHRLGDAADSPSQSLQTLRSKHLPADLAELHLGGSGRETLLVSGRYRYLRHGVHPLLSPLPPLLHVRASEGWRGMTLEHGVELLSAELASSRAGSQQIVVRMLEVLFLQALRCYIEDTRDGEAVWLLGLRDERIARALGCIHGEPERPWSTAALAEQAGMARGAFASQFTALVGEPPPNYLTRWRIQTSLRALREGARSLGDVAQGVGYPTTAAFTRIFKRMVGMPPAEYRRATAAGHEPLLTAERGPRSAAPVFAATRFQRG